MQHLSNFSHTPKCEKTCKSGYEREYTSDKYFGQEPYAIEANEESIRKELFTNGPLEVSFDVSFLKDDAQFN